MLKLTPLLLCLLVTRVLVESSLIDLLQSSEVKITARLQVVPEKFKFPLEEIEVEESYSNANRRSLLQISAPDDSERKLAFYVNKDGHIIEHESKTAACRLVESDQFTSSFFGPLAQQKIDLIEQWLSPIDHIPAHLIGLSRLLALMQRAPIKSVSDSTMMQYVRGKPSFLYTFPLKWSEGVEFTMNAFYTEQSDGVNQREHPIRVLVRHKERVIFMADIFAIESTVLKSFGDLNRLDITTLPLGIGCGDSLPSKMAQKAVPPKAVFSMHVELINGERSRAPKEQFIAFDANQQALRRDTVLKSPLDSVYLKSIYDLKKARQYNMNYALEDHSSQQRESDDPEQRILQADEIPLKECVAAELERSDYESLIPFHKLAQAGTGLVRGQEVDIYEMSSLTLPELFFPPSRFLDTDDKWHLADAAGQKYAIVLYFAAGASRVEAPFTGSLVRVDVFRSRKLVKLINVFNFIWQLAEAPNGDPIENLFALHEACSLGFATSSKQLAFSPARSIHMSMALEFLLSTPHNGDSDQLVDLQKTPIRNAAIVRGVAARSKTLSPVQLTDLRSFFRSVKQDRTSHYTLMVSGKITMIDDDFFRPKMISYGSIYSNFEPIQGLDSFEECFNEASRRRKGDHILFAFTEDSLCYIDDRPIFELKPSDESGQGGGAKFTYSNIFRLQKDETPVRVMQIDLVENVKSKQSKLQAWSQIQTDLMMQALTLPLIEPETMGKPTTKGFFFRVTKMEMHDQLEGQLSGDSISFDGFGLESGHKLTRPEEPLDGSGCRSACLSDLACKSYSICVSGHEVECVVSEVDFGDSKLVALLEAQKVHLDYRSSSQKKFSIEIGEKNDEKAQTVALKLDRRCRLFKKVPLDMFTALAKTRTSLNRKAITQVNSEQECAEKCLHMNVEYLKGISEQAQHDEHKDIKSAYNHNLKNWCATFKFFELRSTLSSKKLLENGILADVGKTGLCLLPRKLIADEQGERTKDDVVLELKLSLPMDTFTFNYVNLFEARENIRMASYPDQDQSDTSLMSKSPFNNRKVVEMRTAEDCARACFMQTSGLLPSCKSFEFVQLNQPEMMVASLGEDGSHMMTFCAFNSMSLEDAKKAQIYSQIVSKQIEPLVAVKHYEPRQVMDDRILRQILSHDSREKQKSKATFRFSFSPLLASINLAICSLAIGIKLKAPLTRIWSSRDDRPIRPRRLSQTSLSL